MLDPVTVVAEEPVETAETPAKETLEVEETETEEAEPEVETPEKLEGVKAEATAKPKASKGYDPVEVIHSLKREMKELKESFRGEVESLSGEVRALKPEKDPLDALLESLPKGDAESEEGRLRADIEALAPAIKKLRPALMPEVGQHRLVLRGLLQMHDKLAFLVDQLTDAMGDNKPLGIKHLDRIERAREEQMAKSGGRGRPPLYHDVFVGLQEQLKAEEDGKKKSEASIRQDEQKRLAAQEDERKRAAGGPRGTGTPPRGGTGTPSRRSPAQIDRDIAAGKDFVIR
jgi:hypothetical protein